MNTIGKRLPDALYWLFIIGGIALRVYYFAHTPFGVRSHDCNEHAEYIQYVADHFCIPPADRGFEFFHPPLYYFLAGGLVKAQLVYNITADTAVENVAVLSLIASCLTLVVAAGTARAIWSESCWRALFVGIIAALPGLIFFGASVNNDSFALLFSFLFLDQLVRFWLTGNRLNWWLGQASIALGILTKANALAFLPISVLSLLLSPHFPKKERVILMWQSLIGQVFAWGWYFYFRAVVDKHPGLVGNTNMVNHLLYVSNSPASMLNFNPETFLKYPFNDPWHDEFGRQFFWNFLYKSVFVGEYTFGDDLRLLTICVEMLGLVIILMCCWHITAALWKQPIFVPMILTLGIVTSSLWLGRILASTACFQDFRYIPLAAVPLCYYAVDAIRCANRPLRYAGIAIVLVFIASCGALSALVATQPG